MDSNPPGTRCRTLIVEDDPSSSYALRRLIEHFGHEADVAETLADGLAKLAWRPCCLLLDLMLPDGAGTELLRRVRDERLPVRVAVVTGAADPTLLDDARRLQPEAMFIKPVDMTQLLPFLQPAPAA